jgi:hypothetical protein
MLAPTFCQNALIPIARVSRDVSTCPPAADTTRPLDGYKLSSRSSAFGFEMS